MVVSVANGQESVPKTAKDSKLLPHLAEWLNADKADHIGPNPFSVLPECIHPVREQLANDPHRPGYHYLPPTGKAWDVNGPIQFDGRYHLFYQCHTGWAKLSGLTMSWGHAVSDDMVHWKDLPIALAPQDENGPHGYETAGIYSGTTVIHDGVPSIFYSCRLPQPLRRIGGVIPGLFNGGRWKSGASSAGKSRPRGTPAGVAPPYSSTWARASSRFSMKYWMVSGSARAGSFWAISSSLS